MDQARRHSMEHEPPVSPPGQKRRADRRRSPAARGFTMVELLCATAVFLLGLSGILSTHLTAKRTSTLAQHYTVATAIGANVLQLLQVLPPAQLLAATGAGGGLEYDIGGTRVVDGRAGRPFFHVATAATPTSAQSTHVRVAVSWTEAGAEQGQELALEDEVLQP
jgi:prepilin-type N-terminal cleavage/methylation domain-containing protein